MRRCGSRWLITTCGDELRQLNDNYYEAIATARLAKSCVGVEWGTGDLSTVPRRDELLQIKTSTLRECCTASSDFCKTMQQVLV